MKWEKFSYDLTILESHLDSFGHVNNAIYLELFEEARWDIVTGRGYGYKKVQESKIGPVILELKLEFKQELRLRQQIAIQTQILSHSKMVGTLQQEMVNKDGALCCRAEFTIGLFDLSLRKLITPTPEWLYAVGQSER